MSDTLLIHYNTENAQQATWALCNDADELSGKMTTGSLNELSDFIKNQSTRYPAIILLSSHCLHINKLQLPTQNMQKMLKAVPYAIEEFIADEIESFHFVIAKNKFDDTTSVVGIEKDTLKNIIQIFQDHGIVIEKIIPDALCLAAGNENNKQWACLNHLENTYLQTDPHNGIIFSHDVLSYILKNKYDDETQALPEKILFFSDQENADAFDSLENDSTFKNSERDTSSIELIRISYNTHPLVIFCGQYKQALPLNLLQHEFKQKRKSSGYWQYWKLAASLAFVWLVLNMGLTGFQHSQIKEKNDLSSIQIEKIYKKAFPKSKKIVNPRVQMAQKLKELKSGGGSSNGLIYLLAESFGTLGTDKKNITLQSLNYRNNRMDIGLQSSNLESIETLNKNLNGNIKIKSEITSSSSEKDKVRGNLRIEGRS